MPILRLHPNGVVQPFVVTQYIRQLQPFSAGALVYFGVNIEHVLFFYALKTAPMGTLDDQLRDVSELFHRCAGQVCEAGAKKSSAEVIRRDENNVGSRGQTARCFLMPPLPDLWQKAPELGTAEGFLPLSCWHGDNCSLVHHVFYSWLLEGLKDVCLSPSVLCTVPLMGALCGRSMARLLKWTHLGTHTHLTNYSC